jgi:polysaccharide pyruvyl transferase WcaK-like protein
LKRDQEHKKEALQESRKRIRESKEKIEKIGDSKLSADDNLIAKNEEIYRLNCSYEEVKKIGKMALETQKKWRLKHQEQVQETQKVNKQLQLEGIRNQELERLNLQEKMRRERLQANIEDVIAQKTREVKKQLHLEGIQRQEFESLYLREKMMRENLQADIEGVLDLHVRTYEDQIAQLREELRM